MLDALEGVQPVEVNGPVWRVTRTGRHPVRGSAANGRWSPGGDVEVLYTSRERAGALAEIGFRLSLEPVWPSRMQHELHEIEAATQRSLHVADVAGLAAFGIEPARYAGFDYAATQALAAAAHFLEFDGLSVPSARHACHNLVLFMDREAAGALSVVCSEPVDWSAWRAGR